MCGVVYIVHAFHAHCCRFVALLHDIHNKIKGFKQKHRKWTYKTKTTVNKKWTSKYK